MTDTAADRLRKALDTPVSVMGGETYILDPADVREVLDDCHDLNVTFDLRWKADRRAIKQWQEVTGRTMTLPDHTDLCVFLMMALDTAEQENAKLREELAKADAETDWLEAGAKQAENEGAAEIDLLRGLLLESDVIIDAAVSAEAAWENGTSLELKWHQNTVADWKKRRDAALS